MTTWSMGSEVPASTPVPPGRVLTATVESEGAVSFAPRAVRLYVSGTSVAVRHLDGRLVWLETPDLTAYPDPDDASRVVATSTDTDSDGDGSAELLPQGFDTGADATAMVNLAAARAWLGATAEPAAGADTFTLTTRDGRHITATVHPGPGLVLSLAGESARGPFAVTAYGFTEVDEEPGHFAPGPFTG